MKKSFKMIISGTSFCLYPDKSLGIILMANDMNVNSNEIIRLVTQIDW